MSKTGVHQHSQGDVWMAVWEDGVTDLRQVKTQMRPEPELNLPFTKWHNLNVKITQMNACLLELRIHKCECN